jgi:hypothetical protein
MAVGAVVGRGRGHEHDGGAGRGGRVDGRLGVGEVAGEGDGREDELAAALGHEAGKPRSGVGGAELDDAEVAVELLPGVGEDASAGVGLVPRVFGAIGTCLALCDDTLGGLGDGVCAVGVRGGAGRGGGGVGGDEAFGLFEAFSCGSEVFAEVVGVAVAGGEEVGELGVGLGRGAVGGRGGGEGRLGGERHGSVDGGQCQGGVCGFGGTLINSQRCASGCVGSASAGVSPPRHATLARLARFRVQFGKCWPSSTHPAIGAVDSALSLDEPDPDHCLHPAAPPSPASWLPCGRAITAHHPPRGHAMCSRAHLVRAKNRDTSSHVVACFLMFISYRHHPPGSCLVSALVLRQFFHRTLFFSLAVVPMPPAPAS